jgi:predicted DNA-binding transcriptional regulator AlpA
MSEGKATSYNDLIQVCFFSKITRPGLLSIQKMVRILGVPSDTLRRWERSGSMPKALRPKGTGRTRYWRHSDIAAWLQSLSPSQNNITASH